MLFIYTYFALFSAFSSITATTISDISNQTLYKTITVDPLGQGAFKTIQSAIDSIPSNNKDWTRIDIKAGNYNEQVIIPGNKPFIYLKGQGSKNTFIVWNASDDIIKGASFASDADNTLAQDISFVNSYNSENSTAPRARAVAARINGDKSVFHRCVFTSVQDTLLDSIGRHYFKECSIYGAVDFIFGSGQSIYKSCTISVAAIGLPGFITAQGRQNMNDTNGFVFDGCNIDGPGKAYLGRAWKPYARVLYYNTAMSNAVVPEGWASFVGSPDNWSFSEYNCSGPGADRAQRVKWEKNVTAEEANRFVSLSYIDNEGWLKIASNLMGFSL